MRYLRVFLPVVLGFFGSVPVLGQQGVQSSQTGVQTPADTTATGTAISSSPQAIALVQQSNQQAGWARDWSSISFTFTATITPNSTFVPTGTPVNLSGEFKNRWNVKLTIQKDGITKTSIIRGRKAWVSSPKGIRAMPYDALYESVAIFPFLADLTATSDANVTPTSDGIESIGTVQAHWLTIHRVPPSDATQSRRLSMRATDTRVWLSPDTLLPIQSESRQPAINNSTASMLVRREYGDYQVVNGIAVPFTIREFVNGNLINTISISGIQFGANVPDSDFTN